MSSMLSNLQVAQEQMTTTVLLLFEVNS